MARVIDLDPIIPEQVNSSVDLLHLVDVSPETSIDKKITVAEFHTTAPDAAVNARGFVNTNAQSFSGAKTFTDNMEIQGDLTVTGNIYQDGSSYETHAEQFYTKKDMIITRDGASSPLAAGAITGLKAQYYDADGNNGILAFDNTGTARVGDEGHTQPLLTRSEERAFNNNDILSWNAADKKAVNITRPSTNNTYLKAQIDSTTGAVTYAWGAGGGVGVSFIGTMAQYETAKQIPVGSEGHIPSGSLVIITDRNAYLKGN